MAKVNFLAGTLSQYQNITPDDSTLYFITDAKKIYKGSIDVTQNIVVVTNFEGTEGGISLENAFEGKFYINITTFEVRIKSGAAWIILMPGYVSADGEYAQVSNNSKLATIGVIKNAIAAAIAEITGGAAFISSIAWTTEDGTGIGKLVLTHGDDSTTDIVLNGIPYDLAYDQDTMTITISKYGVAEAQVISLPKDNFVSSGAYDAETKSLVLTMKNGSTVSIPAASLIDVYTGESTDTVTVTVSSDNKITAVVNIDPVEGNALVSSAAGLKVDLSGKISVIGEGTADKIVLASADGKTLTRSDYTVAELIAAATSSIQSSIEEIESRVGTLETNLSALTTTVSGKLSSLGAGNADEIITSLADGGIQRSAKTIGGATLQSEASESVVATEAAVKAAVDAVMISWQSIN